ncbi:hypothetical protein [Xylella fastidiosa]|uniref:hypothetical protein n=1 Tax=Xylella fastidiosa TaxID=2371 RepID=UPI0003D2F68A|nr:hypothetical protein [Xylella fastidiosa]ETE28960.1 hypothetical protein B398_12375 [Xylella fastidiosa 32]WGZ32049.1 hypothetical protein O4444_11365 [Xylella fastidiosa subsp. pauca]WGZ34321.1 hypothetical protein O4445_11975 [Xylella fastidiosa subsp. pauca]WGZ36610.1 hypothetical protein O4443_11795 [Xylella fastidiosa subsp. pauca]
MEILEAYCEDLGRVIEIYEAQEEYFAISVTRRHRFSFRCSDAACRAAKNPLIVAVNYDKNAEESEKYQQPHFKSHINHPHIDGCIWMVGNASRREASLGGDARDVRSSRPKATNVVDVFEPRFTDTLLTAAATHVRPAAISSDDAVRKDGAQRNPHTARTTTSRLEKVIDCWSQMEPDERRHHHITIDKRTLSFQQLCLRVTTISEAENGTRVVYGGAYVDVQPADSPDDYVVKFFDGCDRFAEVSGEKSLTISLPLKRLKQARRGALLLDRIKQAMHRDHYLRVYAWGKIVPKDKGYALHLDALDNLVLKVVKKKRAD